MTNESNSTILPRTAGTQESTEAREKNRRAYAELVQVLDEKSLQLIMTDCRNDGRAVFKVLREHYQSTEKPLVITLYEELTTLRMTEEEDITDFVIRNEWAATALHSAGETISDNLVTAVLLKGLSEAYRPFVEVQTQPGPYPWGGLGWQLPPLGNRMPAFCHPWEFCFAFFLLLHYPCS